MGVVGFHYIDLNYVTNQVTLTREVIYYKFIVSGILINLSSLQLISKRVEQMKILKKSL